jgi:sigma-E factor negative regulatory protein RseC
MSEIIEHTGIINHFDGDHFQVSIIQKSVCSECYAKDACTASDLEEKLIDVESSDTTFRAGDRVLLFGQKSIGTQAVFLAFMGFAGIVKLKEYSSISPSFQTIE